MSTQNDKITFLAAGTLRAAGRGRFFLLTTLSAGVAVTIKFRQPNKSAGIVLENVGAIRVGPVDDASYWEEVTIQSPVAQVVEFINGDDPVEFPNAVSVTGDVTTSERPSNTFTTATKATINAGTSVDIAASPTRKRITIANESDSPNSFWVRDQAGVTDAGIEIQPGMNHPFLTRAALRIRNNGAGACDYTISEEA